MFDETTFFNLITQEVKERTGLALEDIHLESTIIEDLGLEDEDVEAIVAAIQATISADDDLIGRNDLRDCETVATLIDLLLELS